ncbi:MAG: hypothetical protein IME92_03130 [Proteobacteria bacterium]|nr:hypothetical protein [Pseudomonadota bacterium]
MAKQTKLNERIKNTAEAVEAAVLPEAYAVHVDGQTSPCAEQKPLPAAIARKSLEQKSPAEWAYERIILYIQSFEEQLDGDHEVGMGFVGGDIGTLKIKGMGFFAPDMITFYGEDPDGGKMQLVQHVNQLNVMLVSARKDDAQAEPSRIGFKLAKRLEEKQSS